MLKEATGLSRRGVEWQLNQLKKQGIIRRVGPDKGGHWIVFPNTHSDPTNLDTTE